MKRPEKTEYPSYLENYIKLIHGENILKILNDQIIELQAMIAGMPDDKEHFSYAEGKWTIEEVIGHVIDSERIFAYRTLCFARNEKISLPGFDENNYVANANFNKRNFSDLLHEFSLVRESNIALLKSFDEEILNRKGLANNKEITVRALAYAIAGHTKHHINVIVEKYLK